LRRQFVRRRVYLNRRFNDLALQQRKRHQNKYFFFSWMHYITATGANTQFRARYISLDYRR
jgi:hypothetical protein